jgi:PAS domain S-box-containing protein
MSSSDLNALSDFFDLSPDLLAVVDQEGTFQRANRSWEQILGYKPEEIVGTRCLDLLHPEDVAATKDVFARLLGGEEAASFVNRYRHRDGTYRSISWRSRASGNLFVGAGRDVTEQLQQNDTVRMANQLLDGVLQSALGNSIIATDTSGVIIIFNRGAEQMLGYTAAEMVGRQTPAIIHDPQEVVARGRELTEQLGVPVSGFRVFVELPERGAPEQRLWTYVRRDGTRLRVNLTVTAMRDENGRLTGYLGIAQDVTAKGDAEQLLAAEYARLATFVEHAPAAVAMFDREMRYLAFSRRWRTDYRLGEMNVLGRSHYEIFPNSPQRWRDIHNRCLAGAVERNDNDRWRPDGWNHDQCLKWEVRPWYDSAGQIAGIVMLTQDITADKLMEEDLNVRNQQLAVALAEVERLRRFLEQTNTLALVGGWELEVATEKLHWTDMTRIIHEEDEPGFVPSLAQGIKYYLSGWDRDTITNLVQNSIRTGESFDVELRIRTAKGNVRWVKAVGASEIVDGTCVRLYGSFQDIHEQKLLRERLSEREVTFRNLFELSPVGFILNDLESGAFLRSNKAFLDPTGYNEAELHRLTMNDLIAEESRDQEEIRLGTLRIVGRVGAHEMFFQRRDGSIYPVLVGSARMRTADGREVIWSTVQDMTRRKDLETQLLEAKQRAEAANIAKSAFLSNMSHEIRTPLNAIIGMSEVLQDFPLNTEARACTETIRNSGDSLLVLVNDILDFSKIEAGHLELESLPFDLVRCVESAVDITAGTGYRKGLEVLLIAQPNLPLTVRGDSTRIRQILVNLLSNAIKFTERGEVTVLVEEKEPGTIRFQVTDTGIGIPPDRLDRLFQRFSQVDASTARHYGGTGLGLAICQRLTHLMHGHITVDSSPGIGSTFTVEVPLATVGRRTVASDHRLLNRQVLLIDSNERSRQELTQVLGSWGLRVIAIPRPSDARPGEHPFDMVLQNLHADEDPSAVRQLFRPAIPVTFLTPGRRELIVVDDGGMHVLAKPVRHSAMLDHLMTVLCPTPQALQVVPRSDNQMAAEQPLRLLVAEDNAVNQRVAKLLLQRLGYDCTIAENGIEVLRLMEEREFDVILMDVQMPEMDGIEATVQLRKAKKGTWIVALTANATETDRQDCMAAGMNDYLSKPVRPNDLKGALDRAWRAQSG